MSSGKPRQQSTAQSIQAQDQATQQGQTAAATGTLSQFEGPVDQSPFYKSLLNTGIESTSRAYDTARANSRQRANQAGYGYTQPAEQGNEDAMGQQEAAALAAVPRTALTEATQPALQAAGLSSGLAENAGAESLQALNTDWNIAQQKRANNSGLWSALSQIGPTAFAPFTG